LGGVLKAVTSKSSGALVGDTEQSLSGEKQGQVEGEMDFLPISSAVARLEAGMFGGPTKRSALVAAAQKEVPGRLSRGSGHRRMRAAQVIHAAIMADKLRVYVLSRPAVGIAPQALQLSIEIIARLIKVRGSLPDHAIRPSMKLLRDGVVSGELFSALFTSSMTFKEAEFEAWYQRQKRKRRWLSQKENTEPPPGRPTKITEKLLTKIKVLRAEEQWSAPDSIAKLVRLLVAAGAPNRNLVFRAVQRLYDETGDSAYRIISRKRAMGKTGQSHT
jgi:hypothetical protein